MSCSSPSLGAFTELLSFPASQLHLLPGPCTLYPVPYTLDPFFFPSAMSAFTAWKRSKACLTDAFLVDDRAALGSWGRGGALPDVAPQVDADGAPLHPVVDEGHHFHLGFALRPPGHHDGHGAALGNLVEVPAPVGLDDAGAQLGGDPGAQRQVPGLALFQLLPLTAVTAMTGTRNPRSR